MREMFSARTLIFRIVLLSLLWHCSEAYAQSPLTPPPVSPPTPVTNAPLPGSTQAFAGDISADPNASVILDNADTFEETEAGKWIARGNVHVRYKNYTITSQRADVDMDLGQAVFTDNAILQAPNGETIVGGKKGSISINLRHNTYTVTDSRSTITPQNLQYGIILPIFVYGGTISGSPGLIDARGVCFTTCDFLNPHYEFGAKDVNIIPEKRLIARDVILYRRGVPILHIPYFYAPLQRENSRQTLLPQLGQSPAEGYFAKFAIGYALASALPGILRLDLLQKKGIGTGFEQDYGSASQPTKPNGLLSFYHLYDQKTGLQNITSSLDNHQKIGTIDLGLSSQYQQNSYFASTSKSNSQNDSLTLTRNVGNLNSTIRTTYSDSNYGAGNSSTLNSVFDQTFMPTSHESLQTTLNYSDFFNPSSVTGVGTDRRELDSNLDYKQTGPKIDMEFLANNFTQIGQSTTGTTFFGGLERLPELRLSTDATRETVLKTFLPSTTKINLSVGEFNEPSSNIKTDRILFGTDLGSNTKKVSKLANLDYSGSFQQAFYGNNTAEYTLNGQTAYRLTVGKKSTASLSYTYLRPYGFTPFQFDTVGKVNATYLNFAYQETRQFRLTLATGYDFNQSHGLNGIPAAPWQNLAMQSLFTPSTSFQMRTTASYAINTGQLVDLTDYFKFRGRDNFAMDIGTQYAPQQHQFSNITESLDLPFFRDHREDAGWRLRSVAGYNGFTKTFEYKGLALTRSWHDWEGTLVYEDNPTGINAGPTFTFNFNLKAFPSYQPFATGQFGQSFDPGIGTTY